MTGIAPVMTKGSIAAYFGGDLVIQEIERTEKENSRPSFILPLFFILSLLFQMSLYLYKMIRSRKHSNMNNNYMQSLKTILGIIDINIIILPVHCGSLKQVVRRDKSYKARDKWICGFFDNRIWQPIAGFESFAYLIVLERAKRKKNQL